MKYNNKYIKELLNSTYTFIIMPRHYGKTYFLNKLIEKRRNKLITKLSKRSKK